MNATPAFLLREGGVVMFGVVLLEQCGIPIPAPPVLLAMGALAARGYFSVAHMLALAVAASLLGDLLWYELGRRRGHSVLKSLYLLSLEPDSCVQGATTTFHRYGPGTLVLAKFIPGLSTVAPPMAGLAGIARPRFLLSSSTGAALWAGSYLARITPVELQDLMRRHPPSPSSTSTGAKTWRNPVSFCPAPAG